MSTAFDTMSLEDLQAWADTYRALGHTETACAAEAIISCRRAARDAILDMAESLESEGYVLLRLKKDPVTEDPVWGAAIKDQLRQTHASIFAGTTKPLEQVAAELSARESKGG